MKTGNSCLLTTLPADVFPYELAIGVQDIKKGNNYTTEDDEIEKHKIMFATGLLSAEEEKILHLDIKTRCLGSDIRKLVQSPVSKDQSDRLGEGKVIVFNSRSRKTENLKVIFLSHGKIRGVLRFFCNETFKNCTLPFIL